MKFSVPKIEIENQGSLKLILRVLEHLTALKRVPDIPFEFIAHHRNGMLLHRFGRPRKSGSLQEKSLRWRRHCLQTWRGFTFGKRQSMKISGLLEVNKLGYKTQKQKSLHLPWHVVLRVKRNLGGSLEQLKARIAAGGNFQVYGEKYMAFYGPVVSFTSVRLFLHIALSENMLMTQIDAKAAFLNGVFSEDMWVTSPCRMPDRPLKCYN